MSLWDDIADVFKPKKKKEEEEKRKAEISAKESELLDRLAEIDKDYGDASRLGQAHTKRPKARVQGV